MVCALAAALCLGTPVVAEPIVLTGEPISEGSTSQGGLLLTDSTGAAVTPRDLLCWVDDRETTRRLYGTFLPTPGAPTEMTLPPEANQIVTDSKDLEEHVLTCQARVPTSCIPVPTPGANCRSAVGSMHYLVRNERVVVGGSPAQPSPAPTPTPG